MIVRGWQAAHQGPAASADQAGKVLPGHQRLQRPSPMHPLRQPRQGSAAAPTLAPISSRKASSCFCPITRVLPNQRRSGWMRVEGSSLDWKSWLMMRPFLSRLALLLYMARRRTWWRRGGESGTVLQQQAATLAAAAVYCCRCKRAPRALRYSRQPCTCHASGQKAFLGCRMPSCGGALSLAAPSPSQHHACHSSVSSWTDSGRCCAWACACRREPSPAVFSPLLLLRIQLQRSMKTWQQAHAVKGRHAPQAKTFGASSLAQVLRCIPGAPGALI